MIIHLIAKEIIYRKFNFLLAVLGVSFAVAFFVFFFTANEASTRETIRLTRDMGYNLRIIPKDTDMNMFWTLGYSEYTMLSGGLKDDGTKHGKALKLAEDLGLTDRVKHRPSELSAGECQRVAFARALIHQPEIILADEPTGNLDKKNSSEVVRILADYHQNGGTVIMATHGDDADKIADRIILLKKGRI